jgi:predicted HTH transcriptional regulator
MAKKLEVTDRTIRRILKELQEKQVVIRQGSDKTGKWKIKE